MNKWNVVVLKMAYGEFKKLPRSIQGVADEAVSDLENEGPQPRYWDVKKTGENEYRLRLN